MATSSEEKKVFIQQDETMEVRVRRKVAQDLYKQLYKDHTNEPSNFPKPTNEKVPKTLWDRLTISNIMWVIAAGVLLYSSDIARTGLFDERVKRFWFNIGAVLILLNICIAGYLIIYASFIKKITSDDWEIYYPSAIPIATGAFVFGGACWIIAFWPIYNYFTPFLLFTILMGFVVLISWIP